MKIIINKKTKFLSLTKLLVAKLNIWFYITTVMREPTKAEYKKVHVFVEVKLENKIKKSRPIWILILVGFLISFGGLTFADEIHNLAQKGDLEGIKIQIEQNPELVNARDKDGRTPLHWACRGVHLEVVRFLVDKGADFNVEDSNKIVPLHSLAVRNNTKAIELLLAKGANVDAKDYGANTPLHYAAIYDAAEAAALLIEKGADDKPTQFPILKGNYMGQKPPSDTPELFAVGIVSSIWGLHSAAAFSPDGKYMFFISQRGGESHIWWVDAGFIKKLKN